MSKYMPYVEKVTRNMLVVALLVAMLMLYMALAVRAYAEELHYIRDNNIDLYLPDGWTLDEVSPEGSSGSGFELLANAVGDGMTFDIYYHQDAYDEYVYFDSDMTEAKEYYNAQGIATLEAFYSEKYPDSNVTLGEESIFVGDWDTYIRVPISVKSDSSAEDQFVFFTARSSYNNSSDQDTMVTVDRILVFGNKEGGAMTVADIQEIAEPIVNEFYDFGYDDILMGDVEYDIPDDYDHADKDGKFLMVANNILLISLAVVIVCGLIILFIVIKRTRLNKQSIREKNIYGINKKIENENIRQDDNGLYQNKMRKTETKNTEIIQAQYQDALKKAQIYSDTMYMSRSAIYNRLISDTEERFAVEAVQYAVCNLNVDYKYNALQKAKSYRENTDLSTEIIRAQLISAYGEQFTNDEADYAIKHLN